jgi:cytochrome c553
VPNELARIAAQHRAHLAKQLRDFRDGRRSKGTGVMRRVVQSLTGDDIDEPSEHFARLLR